ncbi:hypothetical protein K1T71_007635 [Dendrolimus kikuchii]|uniref:Uncharacterized protein n=1 Tax=Dendrolimus kikuchii TaxID=765133 RepID=A0ACC1CXY8_9NEOP|nr:hypothetical protein K1T71_007635 [Dendrolimus kikuchii]
MTNRPSFAQLEGLVEFLQENPGIAKGLLRTIQGKADTKRKWASLAISLNALGGANKDGQGWAKYWAEKKCALKKQCAQLSASMRRTGGGIADNLPTLSSLDHRLVALMGGQEFAINDLTLTVNPFPEPLTTEPLNTVEECIPESNAEMHNMHMSPILGTSHDATQASSLNPPQITTPAPLQGTRPESRRRRSSTPGRHLDRDMARFARIEERRVEAEANTAEAFLQMSENMGNIASALISISNAILEIARKIPEP